jgi:hypothetical protein
MAGVNAMTGIRTRDFRIKADVTLRVSYLDLDVM